MNRENLRTWLCDLTLILGICLFLFFHGLGASPFYDKQEAREALVVWEMGHSGNWILPLRNGDEIPAKPPFFHWLGAMVSKAVDRTDEFTTRFPSAVLGMLGVMLTYAAGATLWGRSAGLISAFVLSTSVEWQKAARVARVDMALTFALLCAFLFFLYLYRTGGGRRKAIVFGCLLGLATLSKGPLGFIVPCFTVLFFLFIKRDLVFLKKLHPFTVMTLCAIVAGSWYLLAFWQGGKEFIFMVIRENVPSLIGEVSGHHGPFWWYIPYFFENMAPWSLFFPSLGVFLYRYRHKLGEENLLYILVWFATVFIFFSAAPQKRTVYILSAYPAAALLIGAWWRKLKDQTIPAEPLFITRLAAYLNAGSFLVLSGVLILQVTNQSPAEYFNSILFKKDQADLMRVAALLTEHRFVILIWSALCGLGGIFLVYAVRKNAWGGFMACTAALMVLSLNYVQALNTELAEEYTIKPFIHRVMSVVKDDPLFFYHSGDFPVLFYAGRHIQRYQPSLTNESSPFYILFWENEWQSIRHNEGLSVRATSQNIDRQEPHRAHLLLVEVKTPQAFTIGASGK